VALRIAIVHDVFRSEVFGLGGQNRAAAFWHAQLAPIFAALGHELVRPADFAPDRPPVLQQLAASHPLPPDRSSWMRLFSDPALLSTVSDMLAGLRSCDLVLGWELSPNIMSALLAHGIRFVDASIDAIRFCPDLFLRLRTNDEVLAARLAALEVAQTNLRAVARQRADAVPPAPPRPDSVLFAGQMDIDSSLVVDARVARAAGSVARIEAACAGRDLWLKPHPHCPLHTDIRALHSALPSSRIADDNVYALLAAPWLREILTLSSSVADEAELFEKPARRLVTPDWAAVAGVSRFFRTDARFTTRAFWQKLLTGQDALSPDAPARALRSMFSYRWGWSEAPPALIERGLAAGDRILFGAGGGARLCSFGWSAPEEWGVWSDGPLATLLMDIAGADGQRLRLRLDAMAFVPNPLRPLRISVSARPGGPITELSLPESPQAPIMLDMPAGCWGRGPMELVFRLHDPCSPRDLGLSEDGRRLGLGLRALTAEYAGAA
jgi:hypothetical protein